MPTPCSALNCESLRDGDLYGDQFALGGDQVSVNSSA
jgi:hypothetical protein